jgi:hypothetical protein
MGDAQIVDMMVGALTDPFDTVHMGITAEKRGDEVGDHPPAARRAALRKQSSRVSMRAERLIHRIRFCRSSSRRAQEDVGDVVEPMSSHGADAIARSRLGKLKTG